MRIVSWNCNGALRRKLPAILPSNPDLLVIQEASERDVRALDAPFTHWVGRGHRGLAVIGLTEARYEIDLAFDPELPWFTPIHVDDLRILAVWASVLNPRERYVRLLHTALDRYQRFLASGDGVILGDFNSSTVFDRKHGQLTHTALVSKLDDLGYTSVWHHERNEPHGEESRPTFYMYRRSERTWHLDYACVSTTLLPGARLTLGSPEEWLPLSDHLPLFLELQRNPTAH